MLVLKVKDWANSYENNRTRELKRMDYVLVPNRMDTDGYTRLMDHPAGAAHLGAWIAIIQVASRSKVRGSVRHAPQDGAGIPQIAAVLSRISRIPTDVFVELIPRLLQLHWIELVMEVYEESVDTAEKPRGVGAEKPQVGAVPTRDTRAGTGEGVGEGLGFSEQVENTIQEQPGPPQTPAPPAARNGAALNAPKKLTHQTPEERSAALDKIIEHERRRRVDRGEPADALTMERFKILLVNRKGEAATV